MGKRKGFSVWELERARKTMLETFLWKLSKCSGLNSNNFTSDTRVDDLANAIVEELKTIANDPDFLILLKEVAMTEISYKRRLTDNGVAMHSLRIAQYPFSRYRSRLVGPSYCDDDPNSPDIEPDEE